MFGAKHLKLYFLMGSQDVGSCDAALTVLEQALKDGITLFQWREKGPESTKDTAQYETFAKQCQALCQQYQVPFVINDDVDLALKLKADGVHIGQDDAAVALTRQRIGETMFLGVSAHTLDEIEEALNLGADYVGLGPIYPTGSKADAQSPKGVEWIEEARQAYPQLPIVAIGGISLKSSQDILQAGADGIAVISAICQDPSFIKQFWALNPDSN